jgi:hypothetical protein
MPTEKPVVYLIVHELFGVLSDGKKIELVTPVVKPHIDSKKHIHEHKYKIGRFKDGKWQTDVEMKRGQTYTLKGVLPRHAVATSLPCHSEFSPHPPGKFKLTEKPYCKWKLTLPKQIHQLRLISIPECNRPIFLGDPHGDAVEAQVSAISLAHAFEYDAASSTGVKIVDKNENVQNLDYSPDKVTNTINLHLWAQLEDESGMDDDMANQHAREATDALVALFKGMVLRGTSSLSIDSGFTTQIKMPKGIRFSELMTLAEKFTLGGGKLLDTVECTGKTCGHGGNLYVAV